MKPGIILGLLMDVFFGLKLVIFLFIAVVIEVSVQNINDFFL